LIRRIIRKGEPHLPINAGTAEPFRDSPPEVVVYSKGIICRSQDLDAIARGKRHQGQKVFAEITERDTGSVKRISSCPILLIEGPAFSMDGSHPPVAHEISD
jgi:hypothetical protein